MHARDMKKMTKKKAKEILSGQPVLYDTGHAYYDVCCNCGVTHLAIYKIVGGKIEVTVYPDEWRSEKGGRK